jgi:hypothetical protein
MNWLLLHPLRKTEKGRQLAEGRGEGGGGGAKSCDDEKGSPQACSVQHSLVDWKYWQTEQQKTQRTKEFYPRNN